MGRAAGKRPGAGQRGGQRLRAGSDQRGGARPRGGSGRDAAPGQRGAVSGRPRTRGTGADPVRRTAFDVLLAVTARDAYANLLLAASLRERRLHGQDAALATELVYGTLRNRSCYDAVIAMCADRPLDQIDPPVLEVLRLGAHQLLGMRIKPHAAVATTVDLAVEVAGRRPSGFVNAVLRRVALRDLESWIEVVAPDRAADLAGHLAVRYSHPRWIVTALADALGESASGGPVPGGPVPGGPVPGGPVPGEDGPRGGLAQTEAALAADQDRPAVTLAAVPGLAGPDELAASGAEPARWSPFGAYLAHGDPGTVPAVAERRAGVQDEASQLAVTRPDQGRARRAGPSLA